jgi:dTDP-glucose pyrophosphorylase
VTDFSVLIPAAGYVEVDGIPSSPSMVPVAGKPIIAWTLDYLISLGGPKCHLAIPPGHERCRDYVGDAYGSKIPVSVHEVDTPGAAATVEILTLASTTERNLIMLGDTFVPFDRNLVNESDEALLWVAEARRSDRWCVIETDPRGSVTSVRNKAPGLPDPFLASVGCYFFPDRKLLLEACGRTLGTPNGTEADLGSLLAAIIEAAGIYAVPAVEWFDVQHLDLRWQAASSILAARSFNQLSVDLNLGVIKKSSSDAPKLIREFQFLRNVPPKLESLFPRVFDSVADAHQASYTQEFYGYPSLQEFFLYRNLDLSSWASIADRLRRLIADDFGAFEMPCSPGDVEEMLVTKTLARHRSVVDAHPGIDAYQQMYVNINGVAVMGVEKFVDCHSTEIREVSERVCGTFIHGDLCFSNILYDSVTGLIKLVDPRGKPPIPREFRGNAPRRQHLQLLFPHPRSVCYTGVQHKPLLQRSLRPQPTRQTLPLS